MAVNRFDTPVESQYISQYVPIPFQELYTLGKTYNDYVDKAYDDLDNALSKWGQFKSPSAVDTQRWYDKTLGQVRPVVDQLAANPELIKTAQGRQMLQSAINNVDYEGLSMLQQTRDDMLKRQELERKLSLEGKWNRDWHSFDYANYDTLGDATHRGRGLLSSADMNLTPYSSIQEIVRPYTDQVEDSYIGSDSMYDYYGKTPQRLRQQVDANISEILSTPAVQMHMSTLLNRGYSTEDAKDIVTRQIYRAAEERANQRREANPYAMLSARATSTRKGTEEETPVSYTNRTDEVIYSGNEKQNSLYMSIMKPTKVNVNGKETTAYVPNSPVFDFLKNDVNTGRLPYESAIQASTMFEGMKKIFSRQQDLCEKDGSIPNDVLSRIAKEIRKEEGIGKNDTNPVRVVNSSKYFNMLNKMYDRGMDETMADNTSYSESDMQFLFGSSDDRSLAGMNVLTPKQYVLSIPGMAEFIESQGISTDPVQASPTWTSIFTGDRDYDIEETVARNPEYAEPVNINHISIVPTYDGRNQTLYKVTVRYPVSQLPLSPGLFNKASWEAKDSGYKIKNIDGEDYIYTDVLIATEMNDQVRRRFDMMSEELAGSTDSKKNVRITNSLDQNIINRPHLIAGQN